MTTTTTAAKKSIDTPDEVREFDKGRIDLVTIGDTTFFRAVFEPGWRWSTSVKPIAGTESCEMPDASFVAAGSLHIVMDDGTELDVGRRRSDGHRARPRRLGDERRAVRDVRLRRRGRRLRQAGRLVVGIDQAVLGREQAGQGPVGDTQLGVDVLDVVGRRLA